jgi:hypothetical protein
LQLRQGASKGLDAEVIPALRPIDAIKKSGQIDQFGAGLHEIQVQDLLACHISTVGFSVSSGKATSLICIATQRRKEYRQDVGMEEGE